MASSLSALIAAGDRGRSRARQNATDVRLSDVVGEAWHPELELLSALADGELGPEEGKDARLHVAGCAECTAQVASFSSLDHALAAPTREKLALGAVNRDL